VRDRLVCSVCAPLGARPVGNLDRTTTDAIHLARNFGEPLAPRIQDRIKHAGPLSLAEVCRLVKQVAGVSPTRATYGLATSFRLRTAQAFEDLEDAVEALESALEEVP